MDNFEPLAKALVSRLGPEKLRIRVLLPSDGNNEWQDRIRALVPTSEVSSILMGDRSFTSNDQAEAVIIPDLFVLAKRHPNWSEVAHKILGTSGRLVTAFQNARHHSCLRDWLKYGTFPIDSCRAQGTLSEGHRLLLDGGFGPEQGPPYSLSSEALPEFYSALRPLLAHERLFEKRETYHLNAVSWIVSAMPLPQVSHPSQPLTVSVCVSDLSTYRVTLASSPDLATGSQHRILIWTNRANAAAGHNIALDQSNADWVLCVHQDVYLPRGWVSRFLESVDKAERLFGRLDVVGVYGVANSRTTPTRVGHVLDRETCLIESASLPCLVDSMDELLVAVRPDSGLRFDANLGWHLYGADICLAARSAGLRAAVVDSLCHHDSISCSLPEAFLESARRLAGKWPDSMPLGTSCGLINAAGRFQPL